MLVSALALLSLAPQDGALLLQAGDPVPGGLTVDGIHGQAVSNTGSWVAEVDLSDGGGNVVSAVVHDGAVMLKEEDTLLTGEKVRYVVDIDISPDGVVATALRVYDANGVTGSLSRLALDGRTVLAQDDALVSAGLVPGAVMRQINNVRHAGSKTLVAGTVSDNVLGERDALLLFEGIASQSPTIDVIALEGEPLAGLTAPPGAVLSLLALASDGTSATPVQVGDFTTGHRAVVADTGVLFEAGQPGPFAGSTWSAGLVPTVAAANGGRHAFCARVELAGGGDTYVIVRDGAVWLERGDPHPALPTSTVVNLNEIPLAQADTGELAYIAYLSGGVRALAVDDELLLRSGVSQASGQVVQFLTTATDTMRISRDGQYVVTQATLASGARALVMVERSVGEPLDCAVVANSTGAASTIRGAGSSSVVQNGLEVVVEALPANSFGYLNTSTATGFTANPAGSSGNLCLGGSIGRFVDQIRSSGSGGSIATDVDLAAIPQPLGAVAATAGETWHFQLWHRDTDGAGGTTSNFSGALSVTFR